MSTETYEQFKTKYLAHPDAEEAACDNETPERMEARCRRVWTHYNGEMEEAIARADAEETEAGNLPLATLQTWRECWVGMEELKCKNESFVAMEGGLPPDHTMNSSSTTMETLTEIDPPLRCEECGEEPKRCADKLLRCSCAEEEETEAEAFDRKYPNATCLRCSEKVTGANVMLCGGGGGACETWYCGDCHAEGTHDCSVCK